MALADEIAKKKAEDALLGASEDTDADASTDLPEDTDASEEDKSSSPEAVYQPATKSSPSYVLVPLKQATPSPEAPLTVPTPTPESPSGPADIKTDPETGTPYVEDQGAKIPHAELATPSDREAFRPSDVTLPKVDVTGKGTVAPAPDQLDQVERATLVKLPTPDLGERGAPIPTPASVDTPDLSTDLPEDVSTAVGGTAQPEVRRAALAGETPVALPPEPVVRGAQVGVTPKAQPATPSPEATPVTPPPRQTSLGLTPDEYKAQYSGLPTGTAAQPSVAAADAGGLNINTDYSAVKGSYTSGRGGDGQVHGIILHASDGDEKSGIQTLTGHDPDHQVSAHYFVTKDGRIYNFVNDSDTAFQAGQTWGPHAQYNNASTIGIEQEHVDGKEAWAPAQVAATAKLVAYLKGKYNLSDDDIMGHSDVAPGRKIDPYNYPWKGFFAAVDSSTGAAQPAGAAQPTLASGGKAGAQPAGVGPSITGKATTFGYNDPEDNGVGATKLGQLDTNNRDLIGAAIPEAALRAYVGANPGSWRTARVQVTGANGQQVLVPIVDLGPRDTSGKVVADFTQGLTDLTGNKGDQDFGFRIIPNAGPDVMKDPQAFADEQAAIKAGINTGARFQQQAAAVKKPSYVLAPMAPKSPQQQQAEQFAAQGQTDTLDELNRNTENPGKLWDTLNQPIQGVSDATRTAYANNFKQEATKYAQDFYGEKDPDKAFQRLVSDPNVGTFGQDVGRAATGVIGQVDVGINKMSRDSDNNALDRFAQVLHPESDGPGRAAFIKTLTDIQDPNLRAQTIGKLWANLDPDKQASVDINGLVNSADNVANPAFQAGQNKEIAAKDAFIQKLFTPDPSAKGTLDTWATPAGQVLGNIALTALPGMLRASAFASQIFGSTQDRVKEEHPDWTDAQVAQNSSISTIAQLAPQEALMALSHGIIGPIAEWATNPVARFGIGGGVHLATGAAGGALMQAGANVAEGQPIGQGVPEAAGQGIIAALPFAVHGGVSGALTPREGVSPPEAIPKVNQAAPLGEETAAAPPPTTGPAGGAVHGATAETMETGGQQPVQPSQPVRPVTASDVLGPNPSDDTAQSSQEDVLNTVSHNIFPDLNQEEARQLADRVSLLSTSNLETDRFRNELQQFLPQGAPTDFGPTKRLLQAYYAYRDGPTEYTAKELSVAEQAYNQARNPSLVASGSLKLPIMWREAALNSDQAQQAEIARAQAAQAQQSVTQEAVSRRAYELNEERTKAGQPGTVADDWVQAQKELSQATEPPPATVSEAEPINSAIANRYVQERMATGELGQIDPSQGQSTENMVQQGMQMSRDQREGLIKNFMKGQGGDLDQQGAAIRAREAILSEQARAASRAVDADPTNLNLQAQEKAASNAVTAFHNGPVKKFKRVWSDSGRVLQQSIPLDFTTLNGMKEAYVKGRGNGNEASPEIEPKLKRMADAVNKTANREQAAMNNLGKEIGNKTRGKPLPTDNQIRAKLMEIMKDLPCRT